MAQHLVDRDCPAALAAPSNAVGAMRADGVTLFSQHLVKAGVIPVTWLQVLLEFQRDWARRETYDAVLAIVKEHAGASGSGVDYAYTMVHG